MYQAVSDLGVVLSLDIGARFVRAAIADLNGRVLASHSVPTTSLALDSILSVVKTATTDVLTSAGYTRDDVVSLVVGSPGVIDQKAGSISIAGTIAELDGVVLSDLIGKDFKVTPTIENDVNLVTIAEQTYGEGQDVENFAVMSVGSGIGAGLVLNKKLHRGFRGAAGEIFYVPFGDISDTHRSETDPSGSSIQRVAQQLAPKFSNSRLSEPYDPVSVFDAARYKDQLALAVVEDIAQRMARYIASITAVVDVETVILAGGIGRQADVLLAEIQAVVARLVPFAPTIAVSSLGETAVLMGGIALGTQLAQDEVFAQRSAAYQAAREVS
jgi:predicted NBD/HSP70 family sugar kinase